MATWTECRSCGGTGLLFLGDHFSDERCYGCRGEGMIKATVKAKKDYRCDLCREVIPADTEYVPIVVTPWNCDQDSDPGFYTFRQHQSCNHIWNEMGSRYEWQPPDSKAEWQEILGEWVAEKNRTAPPGITLVAAAPTTERRD